nr:hypothetical protein [Tanacetum cinerariifolium]
MLFNNTIKWIEAFDPMNIELVKGSDKAVEYSKKAEEGSSKRAACKLEQEDAKRQRIKEENESTKLKRCLEKIPEHDDDVTIKATPLSSKSPTIIDYKIYKEGKKSFFKIIRTYGNSQSYLTFEKMFKNFNKEDLEVLWSITIFGNINKRTDKVLHWKLFDPYGVYCVITKNMVYYLLVEKMYLFTRNFLHQMWNDVRLQVDYENYGAKHLCKRFNKINDCNDFSENMVMAVPKLKGNGYTKETIHIEYDYEASRYSSCLIFGHLLVDYLKVAPKRATNNMEICKGKTSSADDEGFIEVKKKKSCGASLKKTHSVGKKDVLTLSNGTFSLSKSFKALNVVNPVIEQVEMCNKASTSGVQEEGKRSTPLVEKFNIIEKHLLKRKYVLVDDDGKSLEKFNYSGDQGSECT